MFRRKVLPGLVVSTLMLPAIPSWGQLEEVVVTARKREESVLNVPIAITALSGSQLQMYSTDNLYGLTERVPGFVMGTQVGSIGPTPSLRGIGSGTLNPTIDQSVSLNVDGVGFSQAMAYSTASFDMKQVEVLRGPQSLYYGKNATAGVISITTMDPGDDYEIELGTGYEVEAQEGYGSLILSGPVTDTLGIRLAGKYSEQKGFFDNEGVGDGVSSNDPKFSKTPDEWQVILRGTVLWEPTEDFTAKLKVSYNKDKIKGGGGNGDVASCPDGIHAQPLVPPNVDESISGTTYYFFQQFNPQWFAPTEDCQLDRTLRVVDMNPDNPLYTGIRNDGVPFSDLNQSFGSLLLDYRINPNWLVSSVTGYADAKHRVMINGGQSGYAGPIIVADTNFTNRQFTEELRFTSNYDGPWNFMAGGYYQDAKQTNRTGLFFYGPRDRGKLPIDIETYAGFGQVMWKILPELELAAGARYTDETRKFHPKNLATGEPFPIESYVTDKLDKNDTSPEVTLTWTPTDDMTWFIGYRKAYKSGSWDTVSNPRGFDLSFKDEEVEGGEGGLKSLWLDRTVALNVSAYYYKYDNLQVGANESTPEGFLIRTLNAASADVYGVDLDATWAPEAAPGLELFAVANYNNATYDSFPDAECWGGQTALNGCNRDLDPLTGNYVAQDLSDQDLLRAPRWQTTFGFTYQRPVGDDMVVTFGSSTLWSDKYLTNTLARNDMWQDSYFKTSASISVADVDGAWEVAVIGNNINNEITAGNCTNWNGVYNNTPGTIETGSPTGELKVGGIDELVCIPERGREIWLQLTLRPSVFF